jgi:hypothetical protein
MTSPMGEEGNSRCETKAVLSPLHTHKAAAKPAYSLNWILSWV